MRERTNSEKVGGLAFMVNGHMKWTTSSGPPARIGFGSGSVPMTDAIHGRSELMTASALTWAAFALLLAVTD